jgi:hypothetical protein
MVQHIFLPNQVMLSPYRLSRVVRPDTLQGGAGRHLDAGSDQKAICPLQKRRRDPCRGVDESRIGLGAAALVVFTYGSQSNATVGANLAFMPAHALNRNREE